MKPFKWLVFYLGKREGSVLIIAVGLIMIIAIITGASLHWIVNLAENQLHINKKELKAIEPSNVERIIKAAVRRNMAMNYTNVLDGDPSQASDDLQAVISANLTKNPRAGFEEAGFELKTLTLPTIPSWMTDFPGSTDPFPKADNPLYYLQHVPHGVDPPDANPHDFEIAYKLLFWQDTPPSDPGKRAALEALMEVDDAVGKKETVENTVKLHIREIPSNQVEFIAVDELDAPENNFFIDINGIAFLPYGDKGGAVTFGGTISADTVVTINDWTEEGSLTATGKVVHPGLAVSWMMNPYQLPEEGSSDNFGSQKYFPKSQRISFDGQQISSSQQIPSGIEVTEYPSTGGMKRVVMDLSQLASVNNFNGTSAYYIQCTGPLARQRGVVIVGAGSLNHGPDCIFTNGALRLAGSQTDTPLIAGTNYGGIVFTSSSSNSLTWNAYLVAPTLPPEVLASSDRATYPDSDDISGAVGSAATQDLGLYGINYNTIELSGRATADGIKIGFGYSSDLGVGQPNGCYVQLNSGSAQVYAYKNQGGVGTLQAVGNPMTIPGGSVEFEIYYSRAANALGGNIGGNPFYFSLNFLLPRFEVTKAMWSNSVSSMTLTARSGGTVLYGEDQVQNVTLQGGMMVGRSVTGTLQQLTINPSPAKPDLFEFSDRFLIMDP